MRKISEVARDIERAWRPVNYAARPYLTAMHDVDLPSDMYGADSGRSVVLYFLANAAQFKGPEARALKAELKAILNPPKPALHQGGQLRPRVADRIDGYDRDDLGESPDY